ncbi:FtsX-like permease family protein [uncultured Acetobacteroides sp.]|uniref:ABC transporter permease n=1 Tax=uncultured Acetobacteroides sp. TaxID=1760811 RepID=UPI0029F469AF|nr:FtsX-like permease family protein [uncultured Acetobacteroides sp.]
MMKHTLKAAFRDRGITLTSIAGLAMGLAAAIFLLTHLVFEFSYDKHHSKIDRIYRPLSIWKENGGDATYFSICLRSLKQKLESVPEVEKVAQLYDLGDPMATKSGGEMVALGRTFMVDSTFISIFDARPVYGTLCAKSLQPNSLILVRSEAQRIFGSGDPVGKSLVVEKEPCVVAAVVEDQPLNSMFQYKVLVGMHPKRIEGMQGLEFPTYVLFKKGVNIADAANKCSKVAAADLAARFPDRELAYSCEMEPFARVHYSTKANYDLVKAMDGINLVFLVVVVLFLLGIAITNYINLSIIKGERRAKEISIRKANGADRRIILWMLMEESLVVTTLAFALGFALLYLFGDFASSFFDVNLPKKFLLNPAFYPWIAVVYLFAVVASSVYPAMYLSKCSPIELQRNSVKRRHRLTVSSVVLQFTAVVFCLTSITVVWLQMRFEKNLPLGYRVDGVLTVVMPENVDKARMAAIVDELKKSPLVISASASDHVPFAGCSGEGLQKPGESMIYSVDERRCDANYFDTYNIRIVEGRGFTGNVGQDSTSLVLSQETVKSLQLHNPVGTTLLLNGRPMQVVGIAANIRWGSARRGVASHIYNTGWGTFGQLSIHADPKRMPEASKYIKSVLDRYYPSAPLTFTKASDWVDGFYSSDRSIFNIIVSGAVMAILLALMGLVALSRFVARQKEREVAVRKVLGATIGETVWSMIRYVLVRILPALPLGFALAYYAMHRWLMSFAIRIDMEWWMFAGAIVLTLLLALVIVAAQTFRTAMVNPVTVLRKE